MSLVIWTYVLGGASLFGLIVGVFSVGNGRMTRREISHFIVSSTAQTREILDSSTAQTREILTAIQQTQGGIEKTLARMEALLQRHAAALERLAPR